MEKITFEELTTRAAEYKNNVGHKCQIVKSGTIEWAEGTIIGVLPDKRSLKIFYQVKLADGTKCVKAVTSNFIKVLDEIVEIKQRVAREAWSENGADEAIEAVAENIGKLVNFTKPNQEEPIEGRIIGVIADKRVSATLYKISVDGKLVYKVTTATDLRFATDFDEEGQKLNDAFLKRRGNMAAKKAMTPEEKVEALKSDLEKAQELLKKAQERVKTAKTELEAAKKELKENEKTEE